MYNAVRDFLINYENYGYMTPNMCGFYHFYVCASAIYLFNVILFVKVTNAFEDSGRDTYHRSCAFQRLMF
jgi:hypothetical protein